jgi:hypothetical protein
VITVAYVNAVLGAIFHVYGNATRSLAAHRSVTPSVKADLRSIYLDPFYEDQTDAARLSLEGAISNVRPDPGDGVVVVESLITAEQGCIFISTQTNLTAVLIHPAPAAASEYYELVPKPPTIDPDHLNPTPWAIGFNVAYQTPTHLKSRCGAP